MIRNDPGGGFFGVSEEFPGRVKALHINWWIMRTLGFSQHYCDVGVAFALDEPERRDAVLPLILPFAPRRNGQFDFCDRLQGLKNANLVFGRSDLDVGNFGGSHYQIKPNDTNEEANHQDVLPAVIIRTLPSSTGMEVGDSVLKIPLGPFPQNADDTTTFYARIRFLPKQAHAAWQAVPLFWFRAMLDIRANDPRESVALKGQRPTGHVIPRVDAFAIVPWSYRATIYPSHSGKHRARKLEANNWKEYSGRTAVLISTPSVVHHWKQENCSEAEPLRGLLEVSRPSERRLVVLLLLVLLLIALADSAFGADWLGNAIDYFEPVAEAVVKGIPWLLGVLAAGTGVSVVASFVPSARKWLVSIIREGRLRQAVDRWLDRTT